MTTATTKLRNLFWMGMGLLFVSALMADLLGAGSAAIASAALSLIVMMAAMIALIVNLGHPAEPIESTLRSQDDLRA